MRNALPEALPPALIARFRVDLAAMAGPGLLERTLGVCVSGGADSLALLLLAHAALPRIEAATVDHGLRPESASEAAFVARVCVERGIAHRILRLGAPEPGNVSAWARQARYAALSDWAAARHLAALMTAHHADDQLETMVMRLNRGSGVGGLAGIRRMTAGVCRPLLGWRRAELEALVASQGLVPVDDPTNRDDRYDRARLRKALARADWLDRAAAARSAAALADADTALDWAAEAEARRRVTGSAAALDFDPAGLPHELVRRIVLLCLRRIDPDAAPRGDALERLIAAMAAGKAATLAGVKAKGGALWRFSPAPARSAARNPA